VAATHRNPILLFLISGSLWLRYAQRTFWLLLLNAPPRNTRRYEPAPQDSPQAVIAEAEHEMLYPSNRSGWPSCPFPATQQSPDLDHHRGYVLILSGRKPFPTGRQPQVKPNFR
jgi:hypothetical protein